MSDRLKALREKRAKIVTDMRAITDAAQGDQALSAEDEAKHSKLYDESEQLRKSIVAEERRIEVEREDAERSDQEQREKGKKGGGSQSDIEKRQLKAFATWIVSNRIAGEGAEDLQEIQTRALQAGISIQGGYLLAPAVFVAELIKRLDDEFHIRKRARKFTVERAQSLGAPTLDTDLDDAEWTTELATGSEDDTMRFGKRELKPNPLAKLVKASKTLLGAGTVLDPVAVLMERMTYVIGRTQEKAYLLGPGNNRPLGLMVASNDGIPTTRDVSTGNTSTSLGFDGVIEAKFAVKAGYWPNSEWLFHRDAVKQLTKLKDGEGQYIWKPAVSETGSDMLLGRPVSMSEFMPNTFTTGQYVGLFGDFSKYWIIDALTMQLQRLVELFALTNQEGWLARYEGDGMPVLSEAFARLKLA